MSILKCENLKKYYKVGDNTIKALDGISFEVKEGEFLAVVGSSGSGKSTLLHMMGGLDNLSEGEVIIGGINIKSLKDEDLTIFRRRNIGFVFQDFNLVSSLNAQENITIPLDLDGRKVDKDYFDNIVSTLGIKDRLNNNVNNLSGGQRQRVAIARALITKPKLILADEPTGNLDSKSTLDVVSLLKILANKYNQTIIMITHDRHVALMADRYIKIEDGKIIEERTNDN